MTRKRVERATIEDAKRLMRTVTQEGSDGMMAFVVIYGIAEGYARAGGTPPGDMDRYFEGGEMPAGLGIDQLEAAARELLHDNAMGFDGLTYCEIEERCIDAGRGLRMPAQSTLH